MENKKIFFKGLNELRAFAALAVIFHHIELFKNSDQISSLLKSIYFSYFIERLGKNGVYLFFVLSGFLITYLLLIEKEKSQTILFKKFYLRRIYRIWPLYYIILIIGFIIIPFLAYTFEIFENTPSFFGLISNQENYSLKSILLYIFFLPNVALSYFQIILVGCSQAWSVGVEEQFYILWPLLIFLFTKRKTLYFFLLLLTFFISSNIFFKLDYVVNNLAVVLLYVYRIISLVPFEYMTIGAIGGYLYLHHNDIIVVFTKSKYVYFLLLSLILGLMFIPFFMTYFQSIILSVLFLCLILITINDKNNFVLRSRKLSYIGKISYGIYMFHPFVMFLVFPFVNKYFPFSTNSFFYNFSVYFFVFSLTILMSHFSYKYFESIFINIKDNKYKTL
ncbi:acyltransferase [Flavobacterium sp. ACN6]|uniref:acyltransferase family protein n=1 Tax=Flavobacterium sp. ACN6 TaxID=1920426 RepID=UPI000BB31CB9|nr:acyltransferase [Flavobacterium sp. ACN6]PBJ13877.1 O-acetyltransferase OatA [Flavobacterium sp. ACN6]